MLFSKFSTSFIISLDSLGTKLATPKSRLPLRHLSAPTTKMSHLNRRGSWKNGANSRLLTEYQEKSLTLLLSLFLNVEIQSVQKRSQNLLLLQLSSPPQALVIIYPNETRILSHLDLQSEDLSMLYLLVGSLLWMKRGIHTTTANPVRQLGSSLLFPRQSHPRLQRLLQRVFKMRRRYRTSSTVLLNPIPVLKLPLITHLPPTPRRKKRRPPKSGDPCRKKSR